MANLKKAVVGRSSLVVGKSKGKNERKINRKNKIDGKNKKSNR
jgi:hypothetical protein